MSSIVQEAKNVNVSSCPTINLLDKDILIMGISSRIGNTIEISLQFFGLNSIGASEHLFFVVINSQFFHHAV